MLHPLQLYQTRTGMGEATPLSVFGQFDQIKLELQLFEVQLAELGDLWRNHNLAVGLGSVLWK